VEVAQIDSNKYAIGIRGFVGRLSKQVLVLIDGRSVYTPLFAGVYWEMQDTLMEDIDHIEVIRGPGGTIWGSNAINGVINIITKRAQDTRGVLVSAGGGNVDQGFLHFRYGAGTDRLSYRVWGKMFSDGPEYHADGRNFDDWRRAQIGFRTDWTVNDRDELTIEGDGYGSMVGSKLGLSFFNPQVMINQEANADLAGGNIVGRWRRKISSRSDIMLQAYWDHTDRDDLNFGEIRDTFDIDFIHRIALTRNTITWGAGIRESPSQFFQVIPTVDFEPHKQTYGLYSGFVQDEIGVVPGRLALTVGTKLEDNSYSGFDAQPSARILYTPSDRQSYWAAVTRALRTSSRIEDNFSFSALIQPPIYVRLVGDGDFNNEQMIGYEAGWRGHLTKTVLVGFSGYYNDYDDLLSVDLHTPFVETEPPPPRLVLPLFLRNGIKGYTKGFEVGGYWQPSSIWEIRGSYSYLHLVVRDAAGSNDSSTVKQEEGDSPAHMVLVRSSFHLPKSFQFDVTYRYVSALPDQAVPAYSTANTRFSWRRRDWEFSVVGQNLLQPYHYEFGGDPGGLVGIRRSVYGQVTFTTGGR
jgi:iron complex outermembrane receptor protein